MQKNLFQKSTMLSSSIPQLQKQLQGKQREEMRAIMRRIAGPRLLGETTEYAIRRASRKIGFNYQRVHSYWYRKIKRPPGDELEIARMLAAELEAKEQRLKLMESAYGAKRLELDQTETGAVLATAKNRVHDRAG